MQAQVAFYLALGSAIYLVFFLLLHILALFINLRCLGGIYLPITIWSLVQIIGNVTLLIPCLHTLYRPKKSTCFWMMILMMVTLFSIWVVGIGFIAHRTATHAATDQEDACKPTTLLFVQELQILWYSISLYLCTIGLLSVGVILMIRCLTFTHCCQQYCPRITSVYIPEQQEYLINADDNIDIPLIDG